MKITKFCKKPVEIEAVQFTQDADMNDDTECGVFPWLDSHEVPYDFDDCCDQIVIPTLEGDMRASVGDWIIRGVQGEFYPCKPDIFAATYEPAESSAQEGTS